MGHQKPPSRLHVGVLENAQAVNEKLLMLLISGGNWFALMTIPHVYRIVVSSSFPLLEGERSWKRRRNISRRTAESEVRSTANNSSRNPFGHIMTTEYIIIKCPDINPFHPNISLHILLTVLYTFPEVLTRRICLIIKRFLSR